MSTKTTRQVWSTRVVVGHQTKEAWTHMNSRLFQCSDTKHKLTLSEDSPRLRPWMKHSFQNCLSIPHCEEFQLLFWNQSRHESKVTRACSHGCGGGKVFHPTLHLLCKPYKNICQHYLALDLPGVWALCDTWRGIVI